jgi:hypothetical protein
MPSQTPDEREQALVLLYRPPSLLKKAHKDLLKTIWSFKQRHDGTEAECFVCHRVLKLGDLTVHHRDGDIRHNDLGNLRPACWECNRLEGWLVRRREAAKKEREARLQPSNIADQPLRYNAEEGARSHAMRTRFNRWAYDPCTGLCRELGSRWDIKALAKKAVHGIGLVRDKLGDQQTYRRYLEADLAGGIWDCPDPDDPELIERSSKPFPFPEGVHPCDKSGQLA